MRLKKWICLNIARKSMRDERKPDTIFEEKRQDMSENKEV